MGNFRLLKLIHRQILASKNYPWAISASETNRQLLGNFRLLVLKLTHASNGLQPKIAQG